jgi:hypothetical protein
MTPKPRFSVSTAAAVIGTVSFFASYAGPAPANAAEVGKSARIVNTVTGSQGNRALRVPDPVFDGERISAAPNAHGEILLDDSTKIIVGPDSTVLLDNFVVGNRGFTTTSIKVAKGAMRFISGNSPKSAYQIETATATIGVRGTAFDVYARGGGAADIVLYRGSINVCSGGTCVETGDVCDIVSIGAGGGGGGGSPAVSGFLMGTGADQEADFDLAFNQGRFPPGWRVSILPCSGRAFLEKLRNQTRNNQRQGFSDEGGGDDPVERPGDGEPDKRGGFNFTPRDDEPYDPYDPYDPYYGECGPTGC